MVVEGKVSLRSYLVRLRLVDPNANHVINIKFSYIRLLLFIFGMVIAYTGEAQLYPGMEGESLADAIREDYTPTILLDDTQAKDTLYASVYFRDDSVRCVYSGLSRYLPEGVDPSIWLYNDGVGVESMNLEHGWPRSKGAGDGTGGNTNMYHLFPSRSGINSDRADHPYGEINDNQTVRWYYKSVEMSSPPGGDRSPYSEYINGRFEPRESFKGDIARAMFYFWTVYRADAIAEDPFYFESQLADLCLWHDLDPVDDEELSRNALIAHYQGGVDNPFIIDCSLVMRTYCDQLTDCQMVATADQYASGFNLKYLNENQMVVIGEDFRLWEIQIFDLMGRLLYVTKKATNQPSEYLNLPTGFYIAVSLDGNYRLSTRFSVVR